MLMKYPKTTWNYSSYTEAVRILQIAHDVKSGFYQEKGFFVLPYLVPHHPKMVYFPRLDLDKIPKLWQKVRDRSQILVEINDPIIKEVMNILPRRLCNFEQLKKE